MGAGIGMQCVCIDRDRKEEVKGAMVRPPVARPIPMGSDRAHFIHDRQGTVREFYVIDRVALGKGSFGRVLRGTHRSTGAVHAIKAIPKSTPALVDQFREEISLLKALDHPYIIKLHENFEDDRHLYLAMEMCSGGELYDAVKEHDHGFSEAEAAILMRQILRGVHYLHEHEVCHRDLKPENFMFQTMGDISTTSLKMIDFGLACKFTYGERMSQRVGTPYYVAPEVLEENYLHLCDIWSCGVMLFVLLCGYPPFTGPTQQQILRRVRRGHFEFDAQDWANVSTEAKEVVRSMVHFDDNLRFTAADALEHAWFSQAAPETLVVPVADKQRWVERLHACKSENKLQKTAKQVMVRHMQENEIEASREIFMALDVNKDGLLTVGELHDGLRLAGVDMHREGVQELMDAIDVKGSGTIDYTDFLAAMLEKEQCSSERGWMHAFQTFDLDGSGKISKLELEHVLNQKGMEDSTALDLLKKVDRNGDGCIDYTEFQAMMCEASLSPRAYGGC